MIARALHALARGLDATADALEHVASPPDEHLARARASSLQPRYEAQFDGVLHAEGDDDAWAFLRRQGSLAGITPAAGVTLAVVDLEAAARALRDHAPIINRADGPISGCSCHGIRWGDAWSEHAVAQVFDHLPTVQGRTDAPPRGPAADLSWTDEPFTPPGWLRRPGLEDVDPECIERLRELGDRFGPLGVAIVAAALTDPNVLVAHLRTRQPTRVVPQYQDETTSEPATWYGEDGQPLPDAPPDAVEMTEALETMTGPRPGWLWVQAAQATEFIGRTVVLPVNRPDVPRGEQTLASARWAQDFDPIPNVVMVKLEGLELEYALTRDDRMQVKTQ